LCLPVNTNGLFQSFLFSARKKIREDETKKKEITLERTDYILMASLIHNV